MLGLEITYGVNTIFPSVALRDLVRVRVRECFLIACTCCTHLSSGEYQSSAPRFGQVLATLVLPSLGLVPSQSGNTVYMCTRQ